MRSSTTLRLLIVLGAAVALLGSCGDDDEPVSAGDDEGPALAETYLSVDVVEAGAPRPLVEGTRIRLSFDERTVGASLGCNQLGGPYRLDGEVLVVDEGLSTTDMGCDPERHAQDEWFAELLLSRPVLAVDGDTLMMSSGDTVVTFQDREVADPDRDLIGTTWEVDGFLEGTGPDAVAMSIGVEQPGTLRLEENGFVVGHDGCNGFGYGTVEGEPTDGLRHEVSDDRITFSGEAPTTLIACPDLEEYLERYWAVLRGTVTWEIDADRLTLVAEDGRGVTYRAT